LAVTKKCTFSQQAVSPEDRDWYVEKYKEILCLDEHHNSAKFMDTSEKGRFITPTGSNYDGESCSAGQDNLSQILTAILSFRWLKEKLGEQYQGGIFLIDELDATLHAFAQSKLLELLRDVSYELALQIVATSHSLRLLEKAYQSELRKDIDFLHLANRDGGVVIETVSTYQEVCDRLKVEVTPPKSKPQKVSVVFEDNQGKFLFDQICGSQLREYVVCGNTDSFGAGQLKNLAHMSKFLPALKDVIFLPDGDMAKVWTKPPKNMLSLPGDKRPETLVYQHLYEMKDADPFWNQCGTTYTRQFAITSQGGNSKEKGDGKKWVKDWYNNQSKHWGRGNKTVFKSWIQAHKDECRGFCEKFIKLLRARYKGNIPQDRIDRMLGQFQDS
jgi:hypothetical protein